MLTFLLAVAVAAGPRLPAEADSAMTAALDSLGITPEQMNFDRHWMRGVALADSTVLRGLTDVHSLPGILADELDALPAPRERVAKARSFIYSLYVRASSSRERRRRSPPCRPSTAPPHFRYTASCAS